MNLFNKFKSVAENNKELCAIVFKNKKINYMDLLNEIKVISNVFNEKNKSAVIFLPKSDWIIKFQLAINKTENVFTPIDIATPIDRVKIIINQLNPNWIISTYDFSKIGFVKKVEQDDFIVWIKNADADKNTYDKNISHIYFSSGSTGNPKGIKLKDLPVINVVTEQAKLIGMNNKKKFAWVLSPAFDASLSDIYLTLLSGGELHICDFQQNKIKTLIKYFKENKITHSDISPSVLPYLKVDELCLESVIFGGEVGNEKIIKDLSSRINMFNAYGPTETSICSSLKKVDLNWSSNNIGIPLSNVIYKIKDKELHIGGENVALGYLDSKLNNKFYFEDSNMYYKTGDLVDYVNDEYFYKGRLDRQFKNNGVLISPEEIESVCKYLGCINSLCKIEDEKFVLYYENDNIEEGELRILLENKLNKNMIPNKIIRKNLETNINGKISI